MPSDVTVTVTSRHGDTTFGSAGPWSALAEVTDVVRGLYPLTVARERLLATLAERVRNRGVPAEASDMVLDLSITMSAPWG